MNTLIFPSSSPRDLVFCGESGSLARAASGQKITLLESPPGSGAASGETVTFDRVGTYTFQLGSRGHAGWRLVTVRAVRVDLEQHPRLVTRNGVSHARRVLVAMDREFAESLTWPATGSGLPQFTEERAPDPAHYGAPHVTDTMAGPR